MNTLEKLKKVQKLNMEVHVLKLEIRKEQRKCKHEYPEKLSFDSKYFYGRCIKCGHGTEIPHNVDISTNEIYEKNKGRLQENWNKLILNK